MTTCVITYNTRKNGQPDTASITIHNPLPGLQPLDFAKAAMAIRMAGPLAGHQIQSVKDVAVISRDETVIVEL